MVQDSIYKMNDYWLCFKYYEMLENGHLFDGICSVKLTKNYGNSGFDPLLPPKNVPNYRYEKIGFWYYTPPFILGQTGMKIVCRSYVNDHRFINPIYVCGVK